MAEDQDRKGRAPKGMADARKTFKAAADLSAKPGAPAAPARGRPRKALNPDAVGQDVAISAAAARPAPEPVRIPFVAEPVSDLPAIEASATESSGEAGLSVEAAVPSVPTIAGEPDPMPLPAPAPVPVDADMPEPVAASPAEVEVELQDGPALAGTTDQKPPAAYAFAGLFNPFMTEDKIMDMNPNFSGFQDAMTEAQAKAKVAFEKSTSVLGEVSDFTKGNVEAVMESGKIFAEGIQGIGSELVTEGRSAFETMTGDIKELAAAKSPTDFFKIQGEMMRKNFDSAVAYGSKNSEAMLKLMSDAIAPISGRVSVAMEKARSVSV